ncbi:hypothetical protein CEW46_30435 [Bacillus cereus]|nr:hypothetical protein CEW46_30435 [Bacillus cereus]
MNKLSTLLVKLGFQRIYEHDLGNAIGYSISKNSQEWELVSPIVHYRLFMTRDSQGILAGKLVCIPGLDKMTETLICSDRALVNKLKEDGFDVSSYYEEDNNETE